MPLISVILPAYNAEKFIKDAIQSILDQTFEDFELIIINDCSTDNTLQIIKKFQDPRIKIIDNKTNLKIVRSLNSGMEIATGKFVARMDADDISLPTRFRKQIEYFNQHPEVDICGSWVRLFDGADTTFKPYESHDDIKASLLFVNNIIHPSVMFRKASLVKNNLSYDQSFINAEDYGLWVAAMDKLRFANVQEVLLKYRLHANNVSLFQKEIPADIRLMNIKAFETIFKNMGLSYTPTDLDIHLNFGLKRINDLSEAYINKSLSWLKHIVHTNNETRYFDKRSLRNVVLHQLFYLGKQIKNQPNLYLNILKTLVSLYSFKEYFNFSAYIFRRKFLSPKKHGLV